MYLQIPKKSYQQLTVFYIYVFGERNLKIRKKLSPFLRAETKEFCRSHYVFLALSLYKGGWVSEDNMVLLRSSYIILNFIAQFLNNDAEIFGQKVKEPKISGNIGKKSKLEVSE